MILLCDAWVRIKFGNTPDAHWSLFIFKVTHYLKLNAKCKTSELFIEV